MFDRVKLLISFISESTITDNPTIFSHVKWEDTSVDFSFQYGILRGRYSGRNNTVTLEGSLHKFQMDDNYSDFSYVDIKNGFIRISNDFKTSLENILITSVELAVNLVPSKPVASYYECFIMYQNNPFIPMNPLSGTNKFKGIRSSGATKIFKLYDKTFEARHHQSNAIKALVPENLLRIEVHLKSNYMRQHNLRYTAYQIMNQRIFNRYVKELTLAYSNSEKTNKYSANDLSRLKPQRIKHYFLIISDKYQELLKVLKTAGVLKHENRERRNTLDIVSTSTIKYDYLSELEGLFNSKKKELSRIKNIP